MKDRYTLNNGDLSQYALMCGYLQQTTKGGISIKFYHEGACYHVRGYDHYNHIRLFWDCFSDGELQKARKQYKNRLKEYSM